MSENEVKTAISNGAWLPLLLQHASRALNYFLYFAPTYRIQRTLEVQAFQLLRDGLLVKAANGGCYLCCYYRKNPKTWPPLLALNYSPTSTLSEKISFLSPSVP